MYILLGVWAIFSYLPIANSVAELIITNSPGWKTFKDDPRGRLFDLPKVTIGKSDLITFNSDIADPWDSLCKGVIHHILFSLEPFRASPDSRLFMVLHCKINILKLRYNEL